ncbi:MAG: hypothetical protein IIV41_01540 [Akkermansia sp.]|nr:hypothetical protein [Akkermansia sp.]
MEKTIVQLESKKNPHRMAIRNESGYDFKVYGYICDIRDSKIKTPYGYGLCLPSGYNKDVKEATKLVSQRLINCGISCIDMFSSNLTLSSWVELREHEVWNTRPEMELAERMRFYIRQSSCMIASKDFTQDLIMYLVTGDQANLPKNSDDSQNISDSACDIENTRDSNSTSFRASEKVTSRNFFYQWLLQVFYKWLSFIRNPARGYRSI